MNLIKILIYVNPSGKEPYSTWERSLDVTTLAIIKNRLDRIRLGNFGDAKMIRGVKGIWEIRVNYGPGYRIYFGKKGSMVIILLAAGNKKTQRRDIELAKKYWTDCEEIK